MENIKDYETREEFAKSFVTSFRQAMEVIESKVAGKELKGDFESWILGLKNEVEEIKNEN